MYETGRGVELDLPLAVRWYRKSPPIRAMPTLRTILGSMYESGRGVAQNDEEAARWYRMAAEQGDATGAVQSGGDV